LVYAEGLLGAARDVQQTRTTSSAQTLPSSTVAKSSAYGASGWKVILVEDFVFLF